MRLERHDDTRAILRDQKRSARRARRAHDRSTQLAPDGPFQSSRVEGGIGWKTDHQRDRSVLRDRGGRSGCLCRCNARSEPELHRSRQQRSQAQDETGRGHVPPFPVDSGSFTAPTLFVAYGRKYAFRLGSRRPLPRQHCRAKSSRRRPAQAAASAHLSGQGPRKTTRQWVPPRGPALFGRGGEPHPRWQPASWKHLTSWIAARLVCTKRRSVGTRLAAIARDERPR
jgi:hypothetical protein